MSTSAGGKRRPGRPRPSARVLAVVGLALALPLGGCSFSATVEGSSWGAVPEAPAPAVPAGEPRSYPVTTDDLDAMQTLMDTRAAALLDGDRAAFLATVDDRDPALMAEQGQFFDNLAALPLTRLSYVVEPHALTPERVLADDPVARPPVVERVGLEAILSKPVSNALSITFVLRDGSWLVGHESVSDDGFLQERPWFGGPIAVSTVGRLVVITDAGAVPDGRTIGAGVSSDLGFVGDVLGRATDDRLLIDASSNGAAHELSQASGEDAAAVTSTLFATTRDGDVTGVAGTLIKLNPELVSDLVGDHELLRHELTHAVLRGRYGGGPTWMSEGIAEYVGNYDTSVREDLAFYVDYGIDLSDRNRALVNSGIWGTEPAEDYLIARASVEYLVDTYGMKRYLGLLRDFTTSGAVDSPGATDAALREAYGESSASVGRHAYALLGY